MPFCYIRDCPFYIGVTALPICLFSFSSKDRRTGGTNLHTVISLLFLHSPPIWEQNSRELTKTSLVARIQCNRLLSSPGSVRFWWVEDNLSDKSRYCLMKYLAKARISNNIKDFGSILTIHVCRFVWATCLLSNAKCFSPSQISTATRCSTSFESAWQKEYAYKIRVHRHVWRLILFRKIRMCCRTPNQTLN